MTLEQEIQAATIEPHQYIALLPMELARDLWVELHRSKYRQSEYWGDGTLEPPLDPDSEKLYCELCRYFLTALHILALGDGGRMAGGPAAPPATGPSPKIGGNR